VKNEILMLVRELLGAMSKTRIKIRKTQAIYSGST